MLKFENITLNEKLLDEEFSYESFISWAARKVKGYSVKEIDHLAKIVMNIKTHEEKTDVVERIREAISSGEVTLAKAQKEYNINKTSSDKKNKVEYLKDHQEILKTLLSKASSFNIISHLEKDKPREEEAPNQDKKYRIDDET